MGRTLVRLQGLRMGHFTDPCRSWRHLRRLVYADGSRRYERGLRILDRDVRL